MIEDTTVPLLVIAYCSAAAVATELLVWALVWRTPGFVALKANLAKHLAKVDEAKDGASAPKNLKKKEARLASWRGEAAKQMARYNMRSGFIMMACVFVTYKLMVRLFGGMGPAVRLPFEPPPFLQKMTHRGLTGADARDGSALFIFVLCQSSVRQIISKALNLGMGREFMDIMPQLPKGANPFSALTGAEEPKKRR